MEVLAPGLVFGSIVGFSLGLTGGGGSIFAVPLLVYGLAIPAHQAVGVSLAVVGATAFVGALLRLRQGEVDLKLGLAFGLAGIVGAPIGAMLGGGLPASWLLTGFATLMVLVAVRMWRRAVSSPIEASVVRMEADIARQSAGPVCRLNPQGTMTLTSQCAMVLALAGAATGFLSGLFGVGGGFLIVPALMLTTSIPIHRAVATSLLVIAVVSASGVAAYIVTGRELDLAITAIFALGGLAGMALGGALSRRLAGPQLQKVFAVAMISVGAYMFLQQALFNALV